MLTLESELGAIDLLHFVPGVGDYAACSDRSDRFTVNGSDIHVLDLDALIASKRATGRPKDQLHLAELEALRDVDRAERTPAELDTASEGADRRELDHLVADLELFSRIRRLEFDRIRFYSDAAQQRAAVEQLAQLPRLEEVARRIDEPARDPRLLARLDAEQLAIVRDAKQAVRRAL